MKIFLRTTKLRTRIIISYLMLSLLPFFVFAMISGSVMLNHSLNTAEENADQLISQISDSIDVYIESIEKLSSFIELNLDGYDAFSSDTSFEENSKSLRHQLMTIAESYPEVSGILLVDINGNFIETGMERISSDPFFEEEWYKKAISSPNEVTLIGNLTGRKVFINENQSIDEVFSFAKSITDKNGEIQAVLLFDIRHDIIKASINNVSIGEDGFVFVIDQNKDIVYTPVNDIVYRIDPNWFFDEDNSIVSTEINGEVFQIKSVHSEYTNWTSIGVFSYGETMVGYNTILIIMLICAIIMATLVVIISFVLSKSIVTPIANLRNLMKTVEDGDFSVKFKTEQNDEIGELGRGFNNMLSKINILITQVYEEQKRKRDAELKILQEQIKPHFLYNTLDTISWMAREYEADDIVNLVDALTNMFRIGLSKGKEYIAIDAEMNHIKNYLYIQKIRYKEKLNYEINIDEQTENYIVPKLILQPLVENAIYHGLRQKRGGGTIKISSVCDYDNEVVNIIVEDDGAGISHEKLMELNEKLKAPPSEHSSFGLYYIAERLKICYNGQCTIIATHAKSGGLSIKISLPINNFEERE